MQLTINGKRLQICVLLCSLLLLEYINFGIFTSAQFSSAGVNEVNMASPNRTSQPSSMRDSVYTGLAFRAVSNDYARLIPASAGKSRGPSLKSNNAALAVLTTLYAAGLINYLRLSAAINNQFDSIHITAFLHKKDGMK